MNWFANILRGLLERSRPQFHPAVIATWQVAIWCTAMVVLMSPLLWLLNQFGDERYVVNFEILWVFGALATVSELVRGHVKVWLGSEPDEWNFIAIGVAGAVAGAVFAGFLWLKWGDLDLGSALATTGAVAATWLVLGFLLRLQERRERQRAAAPSQES